MHSSLEAVNVFEGLVADCEGGVEDEGFVGRFITNLEPGVVFHIYFGFAVPARERFAVLVNLPASFDERASSEENLPSQQFSKGQQKGSGYTGQVMAIALPIVSELPCINAGKPGVVDSLVNQMPKI